MADSIEIERHGIPCAVIAQERLGSTVGKAMAKAQGLPDYPFALIPLAAAGALGGGTLEFASNKEQIEIIAESVVEKVEKILLKGGV